MNKEQKIIDFYQKGNSQNKCAKLFNISQSQVGIILKRNTVTTRNISEGLRKFKVNNDYFEKIDTKDKAYFLGLLIADGNNEVVGFRLQLKESDKHILETFKEKINYTGNLLFVKSKNIKHSNSYLLRINSKKLSKDLSKLGCIPAKSHHTYFPDIPEEFHSHFIRGVFDGDGCTHIVKKSKSKVINFTGSPLLMIQIQNIICNKCNIKKGKIYNRTIIHSSFSFISKNALIVRDWLYRDCEDLKIRRKYETLI